MISCPDCHKVLGTSRGDSEAARMFSEHYTKGCAKKVRKKGCGGCGKKLGFGGGMKCGGCGGAFCVDCRLGEDHGCRGLGKVGGWGGWGGWERARRVWGGGAKAGGLSQEVRKNGRGNGKGWGVWVGVEGQKGKKWIELDEKWAVGKVVDVVGERLGLKVRDGEGRRWELKVDGRTLPRLDKLSGFVKRAGVVTLIREQKKKSDGNEPSTGCSVEARKTRAANPTDQVVNVRC